MNVRFACPVCDRPGGLDLPGPKEWQCPGCDHLVPLPEGAGKGPLEACAVCGNRELYKKKDFPHWLGLTILTVACAGFLIGMAIHAWYWAWGILIGSALFDGLLYLGVGDLIVCYRCHAHFRGVPVGPEHRPFELTVGERYRQERLRRQEMNAK